MLRETFKNIIFPLSAFESSKKDSKNVSIPAESDAVRTFWKRDDSGFLVLTNQGMKEFSKNSRDTIHAPLYNETLSPHLRLMIHHRFNAREFHKTEFLSVNYVYHGSLKVSFPDSKSILLNEGSLFLMNSGVVHQLSIVEEGDLILGFQIEKEFLSEQLLTGLGNSSLIVNFLIRTMTGSKSDFSYIVCDFKDDIRMKNLFEDIFCEFLEPSVLSSEVIKSYLKLFFIRLILNYEQADLSNSGFNFIYRIISYIENDAAKVTLKDLSLHFNLSEKYLSRYIKMRTGFSFSGLCLKFRMEKARYLLMETELTVEDIASECGYTNLSFFYRKFKEIYGMLPKKMRSKTADLSSIATKPLS